MINVRGLNNLIETLGEDHENIEDFTKLNSQCQKDVNRIRIMQVIVFVLTIGVSFSNASNVWIFGVSVFLALILLELIVKLNTDIICKDIIQKHELSIQYDSEKFLYFEVIYQLIIIFVIIGIILFFT